MEVNPYPLMAKNVDCQKKNNHQERKSPKIERIMVKSEIMRQKMKKM